MRADRSGLPRRRTAEKSEVVQGSREDRLLDALRDLMVERDSLDVTLSEVAARADVNHGLVGYYFGSKEGMFVALLLRHATHVPARLDALLRTSMNPVAKLRRHIAAVLDIYDECPILGTLLDHILKTGSSAAMAHINSVIIAPMVAFYDALVEEGAASGDFVRADPMFLHLTVIGACTALNTNRARVRAGYGIAQITPTLQARYTDYVTDFILRGIQAVGQAGRAVPPRRTKRSG